MSVFAMGYQLLIGPLEILYEGIYRGCIEVLRNHGLCIVLLSLVMNFLLLPLYRRADAIQDEERRQEKDMADVVAHIKKTFRGDERFMMLQAYYRQNHYKPFYVLKGFLPLVLEIPFFIAAYHFLSNYRPLSGTAFGPIPDLGAPDRLLSVFGQTVNLLPVLMTVINIISGTIYTKGFPLKDKLQLYGMALLFLVLLYDSPAGLVVYWTLNNLFSLVKNLLIRLVKPRRKAGKPAAKAVPRPNTKLFVCGCVFLALLTGALIPSAVIVSSPQEFAHMAHYYSPLRHILSASLLSAGLFVVWFGIFYYLFSPRGKRIMGAVVWVLSGMFVVNYMFFGTDLGLISAELYFDRFPSFPLPAVLLNLGVLAALAGLMILLFRKKEKIALWITVLMMIAVSGMAVYNMAVIRSAMADYRAASSSPDTGDIHARFNMSRDGNNVVLIMLDRAISGYLPYIMEEHPELRQQFSGFVYYPNTVSFGGYTNFCTPSLFGGYEYTPEEINKRTGQRLAEKQNEALKVLPVMFRDAGYEVTVCDPPYAGYSWVPDLSIYDGEEGITAWLTEHGQFTPASDEALDLIWQRNFFCYSLMKCNPLAVQAGFYDEGYYWGSYNDHSLFERSYGVLKSLPSMTRVQDGNGNTFMMMNNSTTHEPAILSDEYEPADSWSESEAPVRRDAEGSEIRLDSDYLRTHYAVNEAALVQIGRWLDTLRESDVYDNTRIIIVSDHGRDLGQFSDLVFSVDGAALDVMFYNPLLLVKDFGAGEAEIQLQPRDEGPLMTIADVPSQLVQGLIENPVNPFTGNPVTAPEKDGAEMLVLASDLFSIAENNGNTFRPGTWFSVRDNIFDPANWKKLGEW